MTNERLLADIIAVLDILSDGDFIVPSIILHRDWSGGFEDIHNFPIWIESLGGNSFAGRDELVKAVTSILEKRYGKGISD